jgi:hypothetical protein
MWNSILKAPEQLIDFTKTEPNPAAVGSFVKILQEDEKPAKGLAIITIGESEENFKSFRNSFYRLFTPENAVPFFDLGHLEESGANDDLVHAVDLCLEPLVQIGLVPILISEGDLVVRGQFAAMKNLNQMVCLTSVSPALLLGSGSNWLNAILDSNSDFLYKFTQLGHQNYLSDPLSSVAMDRLNFDSIRLGELRTDIRIAEPVLRETDVLHFDLNSLKHTEIPAQSIPQPNGLYSEEACQVMRYAGMGDHIASISLTGINWSNDANGFSSALLAQMVWHIWEGFGLRRQEEPSSDSGNFTRFLVDLEEVEGGMVFWKSKQSGRWWIELPAPENSMLKKYTLLPSSYEDYQQAMNGELPDRFMKAYSRLGID